MSEESIPELKTTPILVIGFLLAFATIGFMSYVLVFTTGYLLYLGVIMGIVGLALIVYVMYGMITGIESLLINQKNKAEHLASRDSLTGLPNRFEFETQIHDVIDSKSVDNVLMLMDLDKFKNINDTLGHAAGDKLLRDVGAELHDIIRNSDTLARVGGDEFAVILRRCELPRAERIAEQMRKCVESYRIEDMGIGISIGIASIPSHGCRTIQENVMEQADQACYQAKAAGRNAIRVFKE